MIDTIIERLVAILETQAYLTTVSDEYPDGKFQTATLPYAVVTDGEATSYTRFNNDALLISRNFYVEIFYAETKRETLGEKKPRYAARGLLQSIPILFERRRRLELNGVGLSGVTNVSIDRDDGIGYGGHEGETYVGTRFILSIEYIQEL